MVIPPLGPRVEYRCSGVREGGREALSFSFRAMGGVAQTNGENSPRTSHCIPPPLSLRLGIHAEFGHFQEKSQGDILQNSLDGGSAGGESNGDWA